MTVSADYKRLAADSATAYRKRADELEAELADVVSCDNTQPGFDHAVWRLEQNVNAVLAGVPAVVCDPGSMAWPVAAHRIGDDLWRPDRTQWAHDLAYTQWTWAELASGEAWAHLKKHFNGAAK